MIKQDIVDFIKISPDCTLGTVTHLMQVKHNPENNYDKDCEILKEVILTVAEMISRGGMRVGNRAFYVEGARTTFTFYLPPTEEAHNYLMSLDGSE